MDKKQAQNYIDLAHGYIDRVHIALTKELERCNQKGDVKHAKEIAFLMSDLWAAMGSINSATHRIVDKK